MCEMTTGTMLVISIASSVAMGGAQMMMAQRQAAQQAAIARQQAEAEYAAAAQRAQAEYQEANRQIAEVQEQEIEEKSDLIRQANEQLGTLRAAETALTDSSLGNLFFESHYQNSADLVRITENVSKQVDAGRAAKAAASQGYINTVTIARNNAQNTLMRTNAASNAAALQGIGSAVGGTVGALNQRQMINALKKG